MQKQTLVGTISGILSAIGLLGQLAACGALFMVMDNPTAPAGAGIETLAIYLISTGILMIAQWVAVHRSRPALLLFSSLCIPILGAVLFELLQQDVPDPPGFDVLPPSTDSDADETQT